MNTKMKNFIAIADLISLMNLICGFLSIIMSINNSFPMSAVLMIFSLFFDSIDGFVARKTNRIDEYEFGKNIDSLSDIVSFGLAPAIFLYSYSLFNYNFLEVPTIIVSLLIVVTGVLRLARYNVISNEMTSFIGFPIPGIAVIIATFYLSGLFNIYFALTLAIIISISMICNKKYEKFNNKYILAINSACLFLVIVNIPIEIYSINIAALIVFLTSIAYLIINLIKG